MGAYSAWFASDFNANQDAYDSIHSGLGIVTILIGVFASFYLINLVVDKSYIWDETIWDEGAEKSRSRRINKTK